MLSTVKVFHSPPHCTFLSSIISDSNSVPFHTNQPLSLPSHPFELLLYFLFSKQLLHNPDWTWITAVQAGLKLVVILLPQPAECCIYRHELYFLSSSTLLPYVICLFQVPNLSGITQNWLCPAYFTVHVFKVYSYCRLCQNLIHINNNIPLYIHIIPHFVYVLICCWTFGLFSPFSYCE